MDDLGFYLKMEIKPFISQIKIKEIYNQDKPRRFTVEAPRSMRKVSRIKETISGRNMMMTMKIVMMTEEKDNTKSIKSRTIANTIKKEKIVLTIKIKKAGNNFPPFLLHFY